MPQTPTLSFSTPGSPPIFTFPEPISRPYDHDQASICYTSELSSTTSTPFVSAPSSPRFGHGFYFSAPTSPSSWAVHSMAQDFNEAGFQRSWGENPGQNMPAIHALSDGETPTATSWAPRTQLQTNGGSILRSQYESGAEGARVKSPSRTSSSRHLQPITVNTHTLKRLHMDGDAADTSYSRKSFYDSAVPFAWEERPGTPKARSAATSVADNSEGDSSSILLSGSSEFEFSARFAEFEEPPMSPTPITCPFKHHTFACSPRYDLGKELDDQIETAQHQQTWALRPPPRLENPVLPARQFIRDEVYQESKYHHRSMSSLSAPQSPRSPQKFDLRGALCGISSPTDAVFDPFVAAMEKMAANSNDCDKIHHQAVKKNNKVKTSHGHHRRTQSLSPLQVFHWDDCSAKSNSSSNGSCVDVAKEKHAIQREVNARHSSGGTPKGSKRWSFKAFLHRKRPMSEHMALQPHSLRSSGRSSGRDSSCSSSAGEVLIHPDVDDNTKMRPSANSPSSNMPSMQSTPSSPLSSSSSGNSRSGKIPASSHKASKAPYAVHYTMQRASTQELRKKTFLPYKQGLLGCLGLSSKSYRALTTLSKPLQSVS